MTLFDPPFRRRPVRPGIHLAQGLVADDPLKAARTTAGTPVFQPPPPNPQTQAILEARRLGHRAGAGGGPVTGTAAQLPPHGMSGTGPVHDQPARNRKIQPTARPISRPATAQEADGFLATLMRDERYWRPNPQQDTLRDGVARLFQLAYPGKGTRDATGRQILPDAAALSLPDLETAAHRLLPAFFDTPAPTRPPDPRDRGHKRLAIHLNPDPTAPHPPHEYDDQPRIELLDAEAQHPNDTQEPAPATGHNGGPSLQENTTADTLTAAAGDDALSGDEASITDPSAWVRRSEETINEYRYRLALELAESPPNPAKLEAMELGLMETLSQMPDGFLWLQGASVETFSQMPKVRVPDTAEGVRSDAEQSGGLPPAGTSAGDTFILGPDGVVRYRLVPDADAMGIQGLWQEIRNQHFAAVGFKFWQDGDAAALIDHALKGGAIDIGPGALASAAVIGKLRMLNGQTFSAAKLRPKPHSDFFPGGKDSPDYQRYLHIRDKRGFPLGFRDKAEVQETADRMTGKLKAAGYDDAWLGVRGSAVTGTSFDPNANLYRGHRFDKGKDEQTGQYKPSDMDFAIVSPKLHAKALKTFKGKRRNGGWIGPLKPKQLKALQLEGLLPEAIGGADRPSTIMIYQSHAQFRQRGPGMKLGD